MFARLALFSHYLMKILFYSHRFSNIIYLLAELIRVDNMFEKLRISLIFINLTRWRN